MLTSTISSPTNQAGTSTCISNPSRVLGFGWGWKKADTCALIVTVSDAPPHFGGSVIWTLSHGHLIANSRGSDLCYGLLRGGFGLWYAGAWLWVEVMDKGLWWLPNN